MPGVKAKKKAHASWDSKTYSEKCLDYLLVEFTQVGSTLVLDRPDITILGWEVTYGEGFLPNTEGGYTVIIWKVKKVANTKLSHQWQWDRNRHIISTTIGGQNGHPK